MVIKFGIIGTGIMGKAGGRIIQLLENAEIIALSDISDSNLEQAALEFKIEAKYKNYQDMLNKESLDAVYVATPDNFHTKPIIDALTAGCHVLVEKPMTTIQKDAEQVFHVIQKTGKKLQINFNHRWLSPYHKIKEMISQGKLGEPIIGYARKNNPILVPTQMLAEWSKNSSPAWFMSSHDIDLMTWWFDSNPAEVYAKGIKRVLKQKGWDTYDGIQSLVTYDNGQFATFEAVWIYPNTSPYMPDSFMEVIGTKGTTHIDRQAEAIDAIVEDKFTCPRTFLNYKVFEQWQGAVPASIRSFIHSIENDAEPHVNVRDGVRTTAILDAIHRSLESRKPEKIEINI